MLNPFCAKLYKLVNFSSTGCFVLYFDHGKFIRYTTYNTQIHKSTAQESYQVGTLVYVTSTISINYLMGASVLEIRPSTA